MLQEQVLKRVEQHLRGKELPLGMTFWDGQSLALGDDPRVRIAIHTPKALRTLAKPSLGKLAQTYVEQQIDLEGDIRDIIQLGEELCDAGACIDKKGSLPLRWWRHTRPNDRKNISYHYDVSDDFYGLWLDQRRVYSCGYFRQPEDSLDLAQEQKLDHICRKLDLKHGERFLDIGCGWGGLIFWAAENYGVTAYGITLSQNQYNYVSEQIAKRGLEGRCQVRLMDYRDVPDAEQFDKIASVGMFEHVGKRNLPLYFKKIFTLLKPGGLVMNHGITSAALDTEGLGSGISEFIDQYVFPGGELVHVSRVIESMSGQNLECLDVESLRPHYGKTLWHWVQRLEARRSEAKRLIGEKKYRIWQIYMAGSAHAFDRGWMSLYQILAGKGTDEGSLPYPFVRDYIYR
jgi:cyclopropane-fatty-acyl-phospholipid synthase